jgi:hypothetical protein
MATDTPIYHFEAPLEALEAVYGYQGIVFPHDVEQLWGTRQRVRVRVALFGQELRRSLIPIGDGHHCIMIGKHLREPHHIALGDRIAASLWLDPEPEMAELPEELAVVLDMEPQARTFYDQLTLGVRRGLGIWIGSAKRPETRANRAATVLNMLLGNSFRWMNREIRRK